MINIGVIKEVTPDEKRVAATPETVSLMQKCELAVSIEHNAGNGALISDESYHAAGASICKDAKSTLEQANVILKVQRPSTSEIALLPEKSVLIASLAPQRFPDLIKELNNRKITLFSLDLLPRIARAQSMDILSSMSNLAGYKSVILAADYLGKVFPMLTTAAGTIHPAKVIIIGAGVAGLQAIATARRLGGVVIAFDTRPAAAEQVKSLGAEFVSLETKHDDAEDVSGYAKEQSADFYRNEQAILSRYTKDADVIITTALIPGKRAPILITEAMLKEMKPGSVIVDLAVEQAGNCEASVPGKIIQSHGMTIIGLLNIPSTMPIHASMLFSKNMYHFLHHILPGIKDGNYDLSDEIIKSCLVAMDGEILLPSIKQLIEKG